MREILFRGKGIYGKWHYGDLINLTKEIKQICDHSQLEHAHSVNPETVGQYTGLTDKNGTKIFEGDIIKHHKTLWGADNTDIGIIKWHQKTCRFYRTSKFDTIHMIEIWEDTATEYEVIGNIHDNPELLESEVDTE